MTSAQKEGALPVERGRVACAVRHVEVMKKIDVDRMDNPHVDQMAPSRTHARCKCELSTMGKCTAYVRLWQSTLARVDHVGAFRLQGTAHRGARVLCRKMAGVSVPLQSERLKSGVERTCS